jgi:large subunit ribosomal protein L30
LRALGLRHHQDEVVKEDGPSIRGMLRTVSHMIEVEEIDGNNG